MSDSNVVFDELFDDAPIRDYGDNEADIGEAGYERDDEDGDTF